MGIGNLKGAKAYRIGAAMVFFFATLSAYIGFGSSFLPAANKAEVEEISRYFFSAWSAALILLAATYLLMVKSRRLSERRFSTLRWTDLVILAEGAFAVAYLLWGISARIQGR
jgi:heme/copper-type cytochrome/quinol oxidase subunit 2